MASFLDLPSFFAIVCINNKQFFYAVVRLEKTGNTPCNNLLSKNFITKKAIRYILH